MYTLRLLEIHLVTHIIFCQQFENGTGLIHFACHCLQEFGPTIVGDQWSDPELMQYLGASLMKEFGNNL